ncbi:Ada metal-binding domain-containing protein [uncultured Legionella sp.]|uniref:Ada metal-binding domain-containing protein n=1 Tax=uncultured Legionella sp. TaxID=210934 RepID=UPI002607F2BF|nr:Ada metal-binding domain-containing protein [uncultured Legionella sp.]
MIKHIQIAHAELSNEIKNGTIRLGGHSKLKIYGTLDCKSGKRMKRENRVFFKTEEEAIENGYRPCGHCMKKEYSAWILSNK